MHNKQKRINCHQLPSIINFLSLLRKEKTSNAWTHTDGAKGAVKTLVRLLMKSHPMRRALCIPVLWTVISNPTNIFGPLIQNYPQTKGAVMLVFIKLILPLLWSRDTETDGLCKSHQQQLSPSYCGIAPVHWYLSHQILLARHLWYGNIGVQKN